MSVSLGHLTNANLFINGWINAELPFPKNDEEYNEEIKLFIGAFEKMAQRKQPDAAIIRKVEKLFSFFGKLALSRTHKSSLTDCHSHQS